MDSKATSTGKSSLPTAHDGQASRGIFRDHHRRCDHSQQAGSLNIDDEGVTGQKTVLVENGILRNYLHDRISAAQYGVNRRGTDDVRATSSSHPPDAHDVHAGGSATPEDLIRSVEKGIYVGNVSNDRSRLARETSPSTFHRVGYRERKLGAPIKDVTSWGMARRC